jgi:hypothetical protein
MNSTIDRTFTKYSLFHSEKSAELPIAQPSIAPHHHPRSHTVRAKHSVKDLRGDGEVVCRMLRPYDFVILTDRLPINPNNPIAQSTERLLLRVEVVTRLKLLIKRSRIHN